MERLRLLKHLVAKTDATTTFTAAEHRACSSLDTFSDRQTRFRFDLVSNSLHCSSRTTNTDACVAASMPTRT